MLNEMVSDDKKCLVCTKYPKQECESLRLNDNVFKTCSCYVKINTCVFLVVYATSNF